MKFRYLPTSAKTSIPSLGGGYTRFRPIFAAGIIGPAGAQLVDGLLDTGADDTVVEEWVAGLIHADLTQAVHRNIGLVGRVQPVQVKYVTVRLRITDGLQEIYEWPAVIGFTSTKLRYPLFGYAGFLQFFDVLFQGADREVILTPNKNFPGIVTQLAMKP